MAYPTFGDSGVPGIGLIYLGRAEKWRMRSPTRRLSLDHLPGVDGVYLQTHGVGETRIHITGVIEGSSAVSYADALDTLRTAMYTDFTTGVGLGLDSLYDPHGNEWESCVMVRFFEHGPYYFRTSGANFIVGATGESDFISLDGKYT